MPTAAKCTPTTSDVVSVDVSTEFAHLDALPVAIAIATANGIYVNRAAEGLTGYARDDLRTLAAWADILDVGEPALVRRLFALDHADGPRGRFVATLHRRNGTRRLVELMGRQEVGRVYWTLHAAGSELNPRIEENDRAFRRVADETPAMLWMSSTAHPNVLINRRLADFLGVDATDLGDTWSSYFHPDDVARVEGEVQAAIRESRDLFVDARVRRYDGSWRRMLDMATPRFAADGAFLGVSGCLVDVTEWRAAEHDRRLEAEAGALLAGSFDVDELLDRLAGLGVPLLGDACLLDFFRDGRYVRRIAAHCISDGRRPLMDEMLARANAARPRDSLVDQVLTSREPLLVPVVGQQFIADVAARDRRLAEIMVEGGLRSLMIVPLLARGEVLGAMTFIVVEDDRHLGPRELSLALAVAGRAAVALQHAELYAAARSELAERRRAEAECAVSDATLRGFFDAHGVYACVFDIDDEAEDFIVVMANRSYAATYDRTPEDFVNASARAYGVPEDRITWFLSQLRACRDRGEPITVEFAPTSALRPVFHLGSINPIQRGSDARTVFLYVGTDITERKQLESQLLQAQKMEAVGRLAGGVAHDFNNLLTVISGSAEFLLQDRTEGDTVWQDAMQIRQAADRGAALTRQLLTFSRSQVIRPRHVDLNGLVGEMEKMLRRLIGEDVALHITLAPDTPWAYIDPGQFEQAVFNLAVNARDAMPRGGCFSLATTHTVFDASDAAMRPGLVAGKYVVITVSDTGVGMDASTQARIFEPFFTTKEAGKGTGLGLSTVFGSVKQAGGHIVVYSEPGVGTTFRMFLPDAGAPASVPSVSRRAAACRRGTETVLLVEDEPVVRRLAFRALTERGFRVLEAASADEALTVAAECHAAIDIVVTDVVLPGANGRELVEQLQRRSPGIKALFMSGYTADVLLHHRIADQSAPFLEKPFTVEGLVVAIRDVLDGTEIRPPSPRDRADGDA